VTHPPTPPPAPAPEPTPDPAPEAGSLRVAPLSTAHLDEIVAIERRCFTDPWSRNLFWSEIEIGGGTYPRGAFLDGSLVGYLFAVLVADEAHLGNLAVEPGYRRRGVAQKLLDDLLAAALRAGARRITLEVRESNVGARKFYERNGFLDVAIRKSYYRNPKEDAIVMLLTLPGDRIA
jgi:ribosomal-protein-alanine N-acetyltransferase